MGERRTTSAHRVVRTRRGVLLTAVLGATLALTGCATGERPTLGDPVETVPGQARTSTGVPEVDALLERLDGVGSVPFSATYRITRRLGPVTADARVDQQPPQLVIEVGETRFLLGNGDDRTCSIPAASCEPGRLDQRISDLMVSSRFYGEGPAAALRVAMGRRASDATFERRDTAGLTADCVRVPVGAGTDLTCVTPAGPLAYLETAALTIELLSYADTPDLSAMNG